MVEPPFCFLFLNCRGNFLPCLMFVFFCFCFVWVKENVITLFKVLTLVELLCHISPLSLVQKTKGSGYSYSLLNLLVLKVPQIKFSF